MTEEPQPTDGAQDEAPEQPEETPPAPEQPEAEQAPEAEVPPAPAEADDAPSGDAPAAETSADESTAADAPAEEESPEPDRDEPVAEERPKPADQPPGAELEPIQLEPERELSAEERAALEAEREERERAAAAAAAEAEQEVARAAKVTLSGDSRIQATGKRKTSVARVVVASGSGQFSVNSRPLEEYFPRGYHQTIAKQPLVSAGFEGQLDVKVRVHGGGVSGQADAVRHGVARALVEIDSDLRGDLKRRGMLTRDDRAKERRKAGLKKARKRPQFSKR